MNKHATWAIVFIVLIIGAVSWIYRALQVEDPIPVQKVSESIANEQLPPAVKKQDEVSVYGKIIMLEPATVGLAPRTLSFPEGGIYKTRPSEAGIFEVAVKPGTYAHENQDDKPEFLASFDTGERCGKICAWSVIEVGKTERPIDFSKITDFVRYAEEIRMKDSIDTAGSCEITFMPQKIGGYDAVYATGYPSVSCGESAYLYLFSDNTHFFRIWDPEMFLEIKTIRKVE